MRKILSAIGHQDWLRFGLRDRILRFFHDPDKAKDEPFETAFFGLSYLGNFSTFIDWSTFYYGAYAKPELVCMKKFLLSMRDPVVLDIGANIGHHSIFASTIANSVHAFEPFPPVLKKFKEKIKYNRLNNVVIHDIGLGYMDEIRSFYPPINNNTGTGSFEYNVGAKDPIHLQIRNADDYLEGIGLSKVDYIKMDIEGFEVEALKGLKRTLEQFRPVVFFEWSQNCRNKKLKSGDIFFPENYSFYQFIAYIPKLLIFQSSFYELNDLDNNWPDGNLLAVPNELQHLI